METSTNDTTKSDFNIHDYNSIFKSKTQGRGGVRGAGQYVDKRYNLAPWADLQCPDNFTA